MLNTVTKIILNTKTKKNFSSKIFIVFFFFILFYLFFGTLFLSIYTYIIFTLI